MFKPVDPKVDFPAKERDILKRWYGSGIVEKYLHRNDSSDKKFSFLDGPITANNPMGVHHGWGRTYKDLWQRFWNMRGYKERFQNGFDCQGLWVEVEVEKELGIRNKKDIENLVPGDKKASIAKFVQLCKDRVLKFSEIQTKQSKRLGYFMDWDNSYYTMSDENNYAIWHFLKVVHEKGWIYKGRDSVPWCPRCETAISQHEMLTEDYKELTHETVFVKLPITTKGWGNIFLLIWTTTPWTVPANVAVGVNTKYTYRTLISEKTGERIIILLKDENGNFPTRIVKGSEMSVDDFVLPTTNDLEGNYRVGEEIPGSKLVGLRYAAPYDYLPRVQKAKEENPEKFHTVVDGSEIVTAVEGTGLLHVAPGAGKEDFHLGKKENLPVISVIADDASYLNGMDDLSGKNAKKHPELIIDYLRSKDDGKYLLKSMNYTHRYPACWRCRTELVWKVADEWYISMDKPSNSKLKTQNSKVDGKTFREQMKEVARQINWIPSWGLERELDWLNNMHDWLVSKKNRYWGLALPIYECKKCGKFEVIDSREELKERAVEGWKSFEGHTPHKPFIDEVKIKCSSCGEVISRVNDVGNVWLDAGIVPFSTMPPDWFPADFITESFPGQFKNWFYSLIAMATALKNEAPMKNLLGFATMVDEKGEPFHKSKGNSIEFVEGADKAGADVIRWVCVIANPEQNVLFGYHIADETRRRFHLMLWNIYNFFVTYANVDRWTPDRHSHAMPAGRQESENHKILNQDPGSSPGLKVEDDRKSTNVLDQWILSRLNQTIKIVTQFLEKYDAKDASVALENFVQDLSLWYVRRSRDRVGPAAENDADKNAFYQTTHKVLVMLSQLLAPFIPFLADEMYVNLTSEESVHLAEWPVGEKELINSILEQQMDQVRMIVEKGQAKRKELGIKVRQPLHEFRIMNYELGISEELLQLIKDELNVKRVTLKKGTGELAVEFDTELTGELKQEGEARDLVRSIQEERKKLGTKIDEKVTVVLPNWPKEFEEYIKRNALVMSLTKGDQLRVSQNK